MPFDDDLSDCEDQVIGPQTVPVAGLASTATPRFALRLDEGRPALTSAADVSYQRKCALRNILEKPMRIHFQGTGRYTTPNQRDIDKLVEICFEGGQWKTGQYHDVPSPKDLDAEVDNVYAVVGTLSNDVGAVSRERANNMPARKEITPRVVNLGETTKITKKCAQQQETSAHREAGSRVLIGIVKGADNSFTFKYYDGTHRLLPNSYEVKNLMADLRTLDEAKLAAMRAWPQVQHGGREIHRSKSSDLFANGGQTHKVPKYEEELKKYFVLSQLIYAMEGILTLTTRMGFHGVGCYQGGYLI